MVRRDAFAKNSVTEHFKSTKGCQLRCRIKIVRGSHGYVDPRVGDKAEGKVGIVGPRCELCASQAAVYGLVTGATVPGLRALAMPEPKAGLSLRRG